MVALCSFDGHELYNLEQLSFISATTSCQCEGDENHVDIGQLPIHTEWLYILINVLFENKVLQKIEMFVLVLYFTANFLEE